MTEIGVVTVPSEDESFAEPVYRFLSILAPSSERLTLFAGGIVAGNSPLPETNTIDIGDGEYLGISLIDYFLLQIYLSYHLIKHRGSLDMIYFHKGTMGLVIPVIIARILGIRTCIIKVGAFWDERVTDVGLMDKLLTFFQRVAFRISHGVVVFTENEVDTIPNDSVYVAYSNYRDFKKFHKQTPFCERSVDLGFVGRFSDVKNVVNVAKAAIVLVEAHPELRVRLVGDGPQYERVAHLVSDYNQITLTGWLSHDKIAEQYNEMKILVAPSKAEGLPTGLVEAMGCGVVVMTTPVGSISELIEDQETGFFLPDGRTSSIVETYEKIGKRDDLECIGDNARSYVIDRYSEDAAQNRFAHITKSLTGSSPQ